MNFQNVSPRARLIRCPVGKSIGGCGARAVSRKTPIYFITLQFRPNFLDCLEEVGSETKYANPGIVYPLVDLFHSPEIINTIGESRNLKCQNFTLKIFL